MKRYVAMLITCAIILTSITSPIKAADLVDDAEYSINSEEVIGDAVLEDVLDDLPENEDEILEDCIDDVVIENDQSEFDEISETMHDGCWTFEVNPDGTATITDIQATGVDLVIPRKICGHKVTAIGDSAFSKGKIGNGARDFTGSIIIPNTVKTIGDYAFWGCEKLTGSLVLGSGLEKIGNNAFDLCFGLTGDLIIPDSVKEIGDFAFAGCSGFNGKLKISDGLTVISEGTFCGCSNLTGDLIIPDNVTTINSNAFGGCKGFNGELIISDNVENIPDYAFSGCEGLSNVIFPTGLKTIGSNALGSCKGLKDALIIPEGVESIGDDAFILCAGIDSIVIPSSVTSIGNNAISYCEGLKCIRNDSDYVLTMPKSYSSHYWVDSTFDNKVTEIVNDIAYRDDYAMPTLSSSDYTGSDFAYEIFEYRKYLISKKETKARVKEIVENDSNNIIIPAKIDEPDDGRDEYYEVVEICINAFDDADCSKFKGNISIPYTITTMDENIFKNFTGITRVVNDSNCNLVLPEDGIHKWYDAKTNAEIKEIKNGTAIRSDYNKNSFDFFRFKNESCNFCKKECGYEIGTEDWKKLQDALQSGPATLLATLLYKMRKQEWTGSCYGISTMSMLVNNKIHDLKHFGFSNVPNTLFNMQTADEGYLKTGKKGPGKLESVINFYWIQQFLPNYAREISVYKKDKIENQMLNVARLVEKKEKEGKCVVLNFEWQVKDDNDNITTYAHSVVAKGIRKLQEDEYYYIKDYRYCILIYDCNDPASQGDDSLTNIYYDEEGKFLIPMYHREDSTWSYIYASDDEHVIAPIDYKKGIQYDAVKPFEGAFASIIGVGHELGNINVQCNGQEFAYNSDCNIQSDENDFSDVKIANESGQVLMDYLFLPDSDEYIITSDDLDITFENNDYMYTVSSTEGGKAIFGKDGSASVQSDAKGDVSLMLVDNEGSSALPWPVVTVESYDSTQLSGKIDESGIIIESDNLSDVVIVAKDKNDVEQTLDIDSKEESILLTVDDAGAPIAFEDDNNDGVYDHKVGDTSAPDNHIDKLEYNVIPAYDYTGTIVKPLPVIRWGETILQNGIDYALSYKNNTSAYTIAEGELGFDAKKAPTITVTSKGNYAGTETIYFTIQPKDITDADIEVSDMPSVHEGKNAYNSVPTVTFGKKKLANKKDFTVKYYSEEECINEVKPITAGTYYAKISGAGNYTGDVVKSFEIGAKETKKLVSKLTITKIKDKDYTGSPIELTADELIVKDGQNPLTRDTHYKAVITNNVEIGVATVKIIGMGDYIGSKTATFKINGIALSKTTLTGLTAAYTYDGNAKEQDGIKLVYAPRGVTPKDVEIIKLDDYKDLDLSEQKKYGAVVSYTNNINAGTATMLLTGVNNYTGSIKKTYKINQYDISKETSDLFTVAIDSDSYEYSKAGVKPVPTVKFNGTELINGKDYTIAYSNNTVVTDLGARKVKYPVIKITGKGNFKGADSSVTFVIAGKNMTPAASGVKVKIPDMVYADKAGNWKSTLTVTDDGKKLSAPKDYLKEAVYTYDSIPEGAKVYDGAQKTKPEVARESGDAVGDKDIVPANTVIKVKITGAGIMYSGTKETTYRIIEKDISKVKVTVPDKIYTGKAITLNKDEFKFYNGTKPLDGVTFEIDEDSYANNIKKGKASVIIKGTGNYGGEKVVNFNIGTKKFLWWWR